MNSQVTRNLGHVERTPAPKARVVLALGDAPHASRLHDAFRQHGWDVHLVTPGADARQLIRTVSPMVSILCAEPPQRESGWLTCRKILMEKPNHKVILVAKEPTTEQLKLANFVGAVGLFAASIPQAIVKAATGFDVPSIN